MRIGSFQLWMMRFCVSFIYLKCFLCVCMFLFIYFFVYICFCVYMFVYMNIYFIVSWNSIFFHFMKLIFFSFHETLFLFISRNPIFFISWNAILCDFMKLYFFSFCETIFFFISNSRNRICFVSNSRNHILFVSSPRNHIFFRFKLKFPQTSLNSVWNDQKWVYFVAEYKMSQMNHIEDVFVI